MMDYLDIEMGKRLKEGLAGCLILWLVATGLPTVAAADEKAADPEKAWSAEVLVKRSIYSHTSYEFGNPDPPYQAPLSRLEFPMNTWWAGGEIKRRFPRFSVGLEVLGSISGESDGSFKDSDWDEPSRPSVKTIYSEAKCRVEPSYMVRADADLKVSDWLGLPAWFDLRPVVGFRWQNLHFLAHDGIQEYPAPGSTRPPDVLSGDAIRFEQTYWQYFLGMRTALDLGKHLGMPEMRLLGQIDGAYVEGSNADRHLLRGGNRWTYEKTKGYGWHALLGVKAGLTKNLQAGLEAEYLWLRTTGTHRWFHDIIGADLSWDNGVTVWSEQILVTANLEYRF